MGVATTHANHRSHASAPAVDWLELISSVPYFTGLDGDAIAALVQALKICDIPAGTAIYLEGEATGEAALHVVLQGTVRIYKASVRGREQTVSLFHPGETFGDIAVFDGGAYAVSAEATNDATVGILPRTTFLELIQTYPSIALAAAVVLSERLRHFSSLIEDLSLRPVLGRVARLVVSGEVGHLTQSQMATMIGSSREVVNRSLQHLSDAGIIEVGHGRVLVCDEERLREIIDQT